MKLQMMTLSQLPHFLRFSVRMLCLQVFFIAIFISSQTPFSYSDSTIFVAEDSNLYVEPPVHVSAAISLLGKSQSSLKQFNVVKHKASLKLKLSSISKNQINPLSQISFTIPKSSYFLINSNNPLSTAVLGNSSPVKLNHKMTGSAFWILPQVIVSEKKLLYNIINHINLLQVITNHFSRPPPIFTIINKHHLSMINHH
ncbi:hypothetical protein SAMN05421856_11371 [Chryseobacterium taichungense]|uniref:Uncharacterized protein n=1 Tax=Chryseobacterium taichungense TaxID=295069 RepID=A0A1H8DJZ6_9FLAO|nr:hypothetical protein [Chryseobacterium taichungense]SEN06848.1 hypothetical protein SAMN05421856_11371 [Chryseobacterium taichungense]